MSKTKATQAADLYSTARENPYVGRLIEDEELRDSLKKAFEAAKGAYGRATSNGSTVKAVTSDKKVQRDLKVAAENLRDASEAFRAPKKRKKSRLGRLILLGLVGAAVALILSEDARKAVLDALFGAEEEFEYSRGLLHYYFGTKERLLVEVVRRDAEIRVARLDEPLAKAETVDDVIDVLLASLTDLIENEPTFFLLLYELFSAGRRNPEIQHEVGQLFERTRSHVADVLRAKEREGVLKLRHDAEEIVSFLFAIADGFALQALSDTERDISGGLVVAAASGRYLLISE
jgi:AcrR family transcriptional regulator